MSDQEEPKQAEDDGDDKPSKWRVYLAWVLGVVALCYLIVAAVMFWNASTCTSVYVDQSTWARWWAGLTCMTANEMGDMLAGMFAPLAFLGLIIAILLQGQDLELQRSDQALTRKVMEAQAKEAAASAKALKAQAEETKRTATFMEAQTNLLAQQHGIGRTDAEFEQFEQFLRNWFTGSKDNLIMFLEPQSSGPMTRDEYVSAFLRNLRRSLRDAKVIGDQFLEKMDRMTVALSRLVDRVNGQEFFARTRIGIDDVKEMEDRLVSLMATSRVASALARRAPVTPDTGNAPKT